MRKAPEGKPKNRHRCLSKTPKCEPTYKSIRNEVTVIFKINLMTTEYLVNLMKKANGGFIVITLQLDDPTKPGEPIGSTFASSNLEYDTVTKLLDETVKKRKGITKKKKR